MYLTYGPIKWSKKHFFSELENDSSFKNLFVAANTSSEHLFEHMLPLFVIYIIHHLFAKFFLENLLVLSEQAFTSAPCPLRRFFFLF